MSASEAVYSLLPTNGKEIDSNDEQPLKAAPSMLVTELGMTIEVRPLQF